MACIASTLDFCTDHFEFIYFFPCTPLHDWQGLYEWRDRLARAEDESTGYILPKKIILEIGK